MIAGATGTAVDNELDAIGRAQARAGTKLQADATLSKAAQCLAQVGRGGRLLSNTVTRHCADLTGVYDGVLVPLLGQTSEGQDMVDTFERFFGKEAAPRHLTHYGAAMVKAGGQKTLALLAVLRRGELAIDELSRSQVQFHATATPGHTNLRAFITDPTGVVQPIVLKGQAGAYGFGAGPGRYQLEVLADARDGPHVVANRALFVGVALPKEPAAEGGPSHEPREARMLALMNEARKAAHAPPLAANAAVAKVALAHARDMRDKGYFAHNSSAGSTLADRLKAAQIPFVRAAENLSAAPSADDAHSSLMSSPGHRKNILDPLLSEVGIGVVSSPMSNGEPSYFFVIDFISSPKALSVAGVQSALLTALNQARAQKGLSPLKLDTALSRVAERHSQGMAERDELGYVPNQDAFFAEAERAAQSAHVDVDLYATNDPDTVRKSQNIDKPAGRLGIGVATTESKRLGASVHWVTIVFGR